MPATPPTPGTLADTGERMIPPAEGEVSFVWERHRFAYAFASEFCRDKRVLDVGCGTGYGSHLLAQTAREVVAIDYSEEAIAYCRDHFSAANLQYRVGRAEDIAPAHDFDVALSFQVIEHVPDPADFLRRLRDSVGPGGLVLVTTPNVRRPPEVSGNPFHVSEMNRSMLAQVAASVFARFEVRGVAYGRPNAVRALLQRTPLYALGRFLKRSSSLKRVADRAMDLRRFEVVSEDVDERAIDLLLIAGADSPQASSS